MDVSFSNVLEGTRQYFLGLPKQASGEGGGWPQPAPPDEPAPAQSGAPTPTAPPPSAAAAPPPPRPPSEPLEPEPHIIHKATVMREAAEKRREQAEPDDDEVAATLSPPPHIIRRPGPEPPAPVAASPRPPSKASTSVATTTGTTSRGATPHSHSGTPVARPPEHFIPARPPDPYSSSRPPEPYPPRYYEHNPATTPADGGRSVGSLQSPQPPPRHGSPQTYARLSSTMPAHAARLRESAVHSPPTQRYAMPAAQPPPHNDRVPPIHHPPPPGSLAAPSQRVPVPDTRPAHYPTLPQRHEPSPYSRSPQYERHPSLQQRKYDPQQAYPGYRPSPPAPQPMPSHRIDPNHTVQYQHAAVDTLNAHYPPRSLERVPAPQHAYQLETIRRTEYPSMNHSAVDTRSGYHSSTPSTSSARYAPAAPTTPAPLVQPAAVPPRPVPRPAAAPKTNYEFATSNHVQTSPARSAVKPGYPNQQARMTVSVTTLVNQMNQTKQKRESPLDLSVKTVKNSADSSTTQDDVIDSASAEYKAVPLPPGPSSSSRHGAAVPGFVESHKVDFAPDFSQYRERISSQSYPPPAAAGLPGHPSVRYNGTYETRRPPVEPYPVESRQHVYPDHSKYSVPTARSEYVPRIDLTRSASDEHRRDNRIRDDRHFIIEERKRPAAPIVSNIPEKIVRYETWSADSRIDRMTQSAREQRELMSQPVYSYSSHKQYEAYQNEQKRLASTSLYRDHHNNHNHINHRYAYPPEALPRERHDYHAHHRDRSPSIPSRQVIQKIPSHRDIHPHHIDTHSGIPADKRVLSILRNSLETKQTGFVEPPRQAKNIPDLIVIDDEHDSVIEITDLTNDNDVNTPPKSATRPSHPLGPAIAHHIQMPKAVDSFDNSDSKSPPENDVASRIRTKAEMKALPPSDTPMRPEFKLDVPVKVLPKSQKQHLFNQIREDQILESVIKSEKNPGGTITEVKSEPMNIDEIEKDAVIPLKIENVEVNLPMKTPEPDDLDWASACDSFMEQLKTGVHKKKTHRRRVDTVDCDIENKIANVPKVEPLDSSLEKQDRPEEVKLLDTVDPPVVIKQEPVDEEDTRDTIDTSLSDIRLSENEVKPGASTEKTDIPKGDSEEKMDKKETPTIQDINKFVQGPKKKEEEKESPVQSKRSLLSETADKEKGKIKKPLTGEKSKVGRPKKSLTPHEEKDQIKKTTVLKDGKELVRGRVKKTSTNQIASDTEKEKRKCSKTRQKGIGEIDTDFERRKNTKTRQPLAGESKAEKQKRKSSKTRHSGQSGSDAEKDKRKPSKPRQSVIHDSEAEKEKHKSSKISESPEKGKKITTRGDKNRVLSKSSKTYEKSPKEKGPQNINKKLGETAGSTASLTAKKEIEDDQPLVSKVKEESESTDDDEPLIKSKLQKEKEIKYQLLKDLSEKSAYVKLECFEVDLNKNTRISIDSLTKEKEKTNDKEVKGKTIKNVSKTKDKGKPKILNDDDTTSCSDDEDLIVATRLRVRKSTKTEEKDSKTMQVLKTLAKASPKKQDINASISSTPLRKPGFGDGSDFRPGWEEELYRYKRSLRMPTRLIAIPRGRSGGPFVRGLGSNYNRGSTSLPDLDPAPLSPAPSSAPSAATDDLYARRQDKLANIDSDLESNSSYSANNRLQYDSEASTSTVFSSVTKKKGSSIVDVLIQKCGKHDSKKKNKEKEKEEKTPKIILKSANPNELLPTPSLGLLKDGNKGSLCAKKDKLMEDIFYLGAFRKETVNAYRNAFIKNTDGLIGATEEFSPVVLKSRTRTESRVLKQRATIKEVFGDERPASAPPTSCREEVESQDLDTEEQEDEPLAEIKKEKDPEPQSKLKSKKIIKEKLKRRSSSIRDGLRSTKSLKRNDAKGRLMRLKHRNSLIKSLASKRIKDLSCNKIKKEKPDDQAEVDKSKEGGSPSTMEGTKRRLKRLFGRRKFSSGFDYIRKKKKIIRREETPNNKIRRPAAKPSPESVHDIQKEIKGWFINKSVGETHLHRAARLGYTDCVAYCLEKMEAEPSAKDNAGFTPLHVAAARGHVRIARLLLQYGANVSAAANGGIRPLHEACENGHVEIIRLLLAYGADPLLGTYAGQTPEELTEGPAALLLRLHIADVQGVAFEPWRFPPPAEIIDREELGCDPLSSPPPGSPPPPPDTTIEMQCTEFPLPPFYSLKTAPGQPADGLWCLLQDVTNLLQIKSKDSLLKQIHCGSGSPKELFRELRTQEFLERAQCHQLLCAGEKVNIRASKVALVRVTDKLRQLLKIETVLIS